MLQNTFRHIHGVGEFREVSLWAAGVTSWEQGRSAVGLPLPRRLQETWDIQIRVSALQLERGNAAYFTDLLPANQHWRLFREFQDSCAFLDVETTGLFGPCEVTTIALYDGQEIRHYVNGHNMREFPQDVKRYKLLVTYNGKSFDLPILERYFRIRLRQAHIDLCHTLRSLDLRGGLRGCEAALRLARPGLEDVDGRLAVRLWEEYRSGTSAALNTLLAYNIQDVLVLHTLMVHAYNKKVKRTPFSISLSLPRPKTPKNPFRPNRALVERLVRERFADGYGFGTDLLARPGPLAGAGNVRITLTTPSDARVT